MKVKEGQIVLLFVILLGGMSMLWLNLHSRHDSLTPHIDLRQEREMLQLTLNRYQSLARNITSRMQSAEQVIRILQDQIDAVAPRKPNALDWQWEGRLPTEEERIAYEAAGGVGADLSESSSASSAGGKDSGKTAEGQGQKDASGVKHFDNDEGDAQKEEEEEEPEAPETEEERAKRVKDEDAAHKKLIGWDPATNTFKQRWRSDFQCGNRVPTLPDGRAVECDPGGEAPCCSSGGWCGKSSNHCECEGCMDYSFMVKISVKNVAVEHPKRECESANTNFGNIATPEECAKLILADNTCGRLLMFSRNYPDWGCRCCASLTGPGQDVKPDWEIYRVEVKVEPIVPEDA